jgi:hypothetical protein
VTRNPGWFGEAVARDRLKHLGGRVLDGNPGGSWDLEWLPPTPYLPTFFEVKAHREPRKAELTEGEVEFAKDVVQLGYSWGLIDVEYVAEPDPRYPVGRRGSKTVFRPTKVELESHLNISRSRLPDIHAALAEARDRSTACATSLHEGCFYALCTCDHHALAAGRST